MPCAPRPSSARHRRPRGRRGRRRRQPDPRGRERRARRRAGSRSGPSRRSRRLDQLGPSRSVDLSDALVHRGPHRHRRRRRPRGRGTRRAAAASDRPARPSAGPHRRRRGAARARARAVHHDATSRRARGGADRGRSGSTLLALVDQLDAAFERRRRPTRTSRATGHVRAPLPSRATFVKKFAQQLFEPRDHSRPPRDSTPTTAHAAARRCRIAGLVLVHRAAFVLPALADVPRLERLFFDVPVPHPSPHPVARPPLGAAAASPASVELGLSQDLVAALAPPRHRRARSRSRPPRCVDALAGTDVLGRGRTGSGKTLAFGLPAARPPRRRHASQGKRPRGLVLVPTRELATQVSDALEPLAHAIGLKVRPIIGGASFPKQREALQRGVDIIVATPGPPHRPRRAGRLQARPDRDRRPRRGRPHGRHGLHARRHRAARHGARRRPAPAVLGDARPRGRQARPPLPAVAGHPLGRRPDRQRRRRWSTTCSSSVPRTSSPSPPRSPHREGRTILFVRTKHGADRLATAAQPRRASRPRRCTAARRRASAPARSPSSVRAASPRSSPPTSPPAASTSTTSAWSSTSTRRPTPRTTCTARAARRAPASPARSSRWCCPKQQREVDTMASKAGVELERLRVRPGDAELVDADRCAHAERRARRREAGRRLEPDGQQAPVDAASR